MIIISSTSISAIACTPGSQWGSGSTLHSMYIHMCSIYTTLAYMIGILCGICISSTPMGIPSLSISYSRTGTPPGCYTCWVGLYAIIYVGGGGWVWCSCGAGSSRMGILVVLMCYLIHSRTVCLASNSNIPDGHMS